MILIADSGSTKTDWCYADDGRVLKRITSQGINPFHQDADDIYRIVKDNMLTNIGGEIPCSLYFYGSGCRADISYVVVNALKRVFPTDISIEVHSDLLGAARGVCGRNPGIACILGTGSNSCVYDGNDIIQNIPPLGYILGDEGSGAVLGRNFLNALFKKRLSSEISDCFLSECGITVDDAIRRVYREPLANMFLASISQFIHRHIVEPELRGLVIDNFRSFFRNNVLAYNRPDLEVGVVGSIGYYYSAELSEAAEAEGVKLSNVVRSPMDGLLQYHFK